MTVDFEIRVYSVAAFIGNLKLCFKETYRSNT